MRSRRRELLSKLKHELVTARGLAPPRVAVPLTVEWARDLVQRRRYPPLSEAELLATRRTDTVFIFGSGYSINDIGSDEWERFAAHDTMSFNWFQHQQWVRIDYHLIREIANVNDDPLVWRPALRQYGDLLRGNPRYADTIYVVQRGWQAINANRLISSRGLPEGSRLFRFTNRARYGYEPPSESFSRGLCHSAMTLGDCINFAYLVGWRSIVVVGVDMYDHRYFWLPPDQIRHEAPPPAGRKLDEPFAASDTVVSTLGKWGEWLAARGVALSVYNPRSLLAEVLPVYEGPQSAG